MGFFQMKITIATKMIHPIRIISFSWLEKKIPQLFTSSYPSTLFVEFIFISNKNTKKILYSTPEVVKDGGREKEEGFKCVLYIRSLHHLHLQLSFYITNNSKTAVS
jgi:hypothetical protein